MSIFTLLKGPGGRQGFSLIELLIAMVVLAIGILATMAMQFSALSGYTAAREATNATELAQTVEQIIQAEARNWEVGQNPAGVQDTEAYSDNGYFSTAFSGSGWNRVSSDPVTLRRNAGGAQDDGTNRFCVYVAGDELEDGFARVAIAVVYPASGGNFGEWNHDCPDDGNIDLNSGDREDLELDGLRVTHVSTAVQAMPSNSP